jgi:glycosyltransferase involved in cell wall biosynthesis
MEKIAVLHLITHLGIGGAQDNTLLTVKGHSRERYQVHLMAGQYYTDWEARGQAYADAYFRVPSLDRAVHPRSDRQALNDITDHMKKHKYTIVHTHSSKAGILGRLAARRAGVPIIVHTIHGFPWHDYMFPAMRWFYVLLEQYTASFTDALITVSELNRDEAISKHLAPADKITTIYSGIDLSKFQVDVGRSEKCKKVGLKPDQPIVGTVGRLSTQKAPLDFISAAKQVLQRKSDVQFILVGDGPLETQVQHAIRGEKRIKLLGFRDDVPELLSIMDVFALSSLWEGLGRALTEAMTMGRPVAATHVNGVPELVVHGETGLLSRPKEPQGLAENILWLLDHPHEAKKMGQAGKTRVVAEFSAARMVRRIEALYERLLIQ